MKLTQRIELPSAALIMEATVGIFTIKKNGKIVSIEPGMMQLPTLNKIVRNGYTSFEELTEYEAYLRFCGLVEYAKTNC